MCCSLGLRGTEQRLTGPSCILKSHMMCSPY